MSDTGVTAYVKMPPAAFRDPRMKGDHFKILGLISETRDWDTDVSDLSQVQIAQALNKDRRNIQRIYRDLVAWGYLQKVGRVPGFGSHQVKVVLDLPASQGTHPPCVTGDAPPAPPGTQPPASQGTHPPCVTGDALSTSNLSPSNQRGRAGAPEADGAGAPGSYWTLLLEASDLKPGTPLVVEGRNLGFARVNGRDGLQEQYEIFCDHRRRKKFRKPARRAEFRWWLRNAANDRSEITTPAEKNSSASALPKPGDGARVWRASVSPAFNGSGDARRADWCAVMEGIAQARGVAAVMNWLEACRIEPGGAGVLVIRTDNDRVNFRRDYIRTHFTDDLARLWAARVPGVAVQILGPLD